MKDSNTNQDVILDQLTNTILLDKLHPKDQKKLSRIQNPKLHRFIADYIRLCNPDTVFLCDDSNKDLQYIRESAIKNREEKQLSIKTHTVHFDGYNDQARDKERTKFLVPEGVNLGPEINTIDKEEGLRDLDSILNNIMKGHELYIKFFCLGPTKSKFTKLCVQLTDSSYVVHSENLLYRQGYEEFISRGSEEPFLKFVHSQGELEETGLNLLVSKNLDKRRVYIDLDDEIIYSTNTQYGGNTIGLKKLAMRLTINTASKEGWLTEHMFIMGIRGPNGRISYFTGAYPSMCGKTATAMIEGETIIGDDIAYIKKIEGKVRTVNAEKGMFGIIEGINSVDEPLLWTALTSPEEIIFSNILVTQENIPYWVGKDGECPKTGTNYSGKWFINKVDEEGNKIPPSHKNARFTFDMNILENLDPKINDPDGVEISGIIYGGRDSDTWVPVEEAFDWTHGIITKGAILESETTAATLGKEGVRVFNPMANIDFLSIPIGQYIESNLNFGIGLTSPPRIFSVNYFLRDSDGAYLNHKKDKSIWLKWMELRTHNDVDAINIPTGLIPKYQDIKRLFKEILDEDYSEVDYNKQFTLRVTENIAKINRVLKIYQTRVYDTPQLLFRILKEQKKRLIETKLRYGKYVTPDTFMI